MGSWCTRSRKGHSERLRRGPTAVTPKTTSMSNWTGAGQCDGRRSEVHRAEGHSDGAESWVRGMASAG